MRSRASSGTWPRSSAGARLASAHERGQIPWLSADVTEETVLGAGNIGYGDLGREDTHLSKEVATLGRDRVGRVDRVIGQMRVEAGQR